jgi:protein CpxP
MKKILSVIGLSLALTLSGVVLANGDGEHRMGHGGHGESHMMQRILSTLDLTQAQQAAINALHQSHRDSMQQLHEGRGQDAREQMKILIQAETFDEAAFRDLLESKQDLHIEKSVLKAKVKNGVWNILSTEQQQRLTEMMAQRKKRGSHKGHRAMRRQSEQ